VAGVDEELEGGAEKVATDLKDSTEEQFITSKGYFKNPKWRKRWVTIPLAWIVGAIYLIIISNYIYDWAKNKEFDRKKDLKSLRVTAVKGRMDYDIKRFVVRAGQPVKLEFVNPDAMAHNLVIVKPDSVNAVGAAVDRMIADPKQVKIGQYIPETDAVLFHTKMILPNSNETLRFHAPKKPGNYPYICTFPGHWNTMKGIMVVR
jgi:azurin